MVKKLTCLLMKGHRRHLYYDRIAEFLFANGVTIPVRCKDCKHCDPENLHCDHPMGTTFPFRRKPDDFCSYGERKDNETDQCL